jgi:hypothetical protein
VRESFEGKLSFMGIKAKRDLYAVLTHEQREKQKALRNQMREMHRARMFSSQGKDAADPEQTADGMTRHRRTYSKRILAKERLGPGQR